MRKLVKAVATTMCAVMLTVTGSGVITANAATPTTQPTPVPAEKNAQKKVEAVIGKGFLDIKNSFHHVYLASKAKKPVTLDKFLADVLGTTDEIVKNTLGFTQKEVGKTLDFVVGEVSGDTNEYVTDVEKTVDGFVKDTLENVNDLLNDPNTTPEDFADAMEKLGEGFADEMEKISEQFGNKMDKKYDDPKKASEVVNSVLSGLDKILQGGKSGRK